MSWAIHCPPTKPRESGTTERAPVRRSSICNCRCAASRISVKTRRFPSGDQFAASESLAITFCGTPRSMLITYVSESEFPYTTRLPSGDMKGYSARSGGYVSCKRSVPSVRLRQRVWSGKEVYATHFPSLENVGPKAEIPERKGWNCFEFRL